MENYGELLVEVIVLRITHRVRYCNNPGTGIARQRKAINDGLRQSVVDFTGEVEDTGAGEVIKMMMMTQYFDTLGYATMAVSLFEAPKQGNISYFYVAVYLSLTICLFPIIRTAVH